MDKQIHEKKKNWVEHLQRMISERAPKRSVTCYHLIGRPRRWPDIWGWNGLTSLTLADDDE
jgi:hypothetical protein